MSRTPDRPTPNATRRMNATRSRAPFVRRHRLWLICGAVALTAANACSPDDTDGHPARFILSQAWDTTMVVGTTSVDDTVLVDPTRLLVWDDQLVVLESQVQAVRAFNMRGELRWAFGHAGQGPGEMGHAEEIFVLPNGELGIWDGRNRKVLRLSVSGDLLGEEYFRDLWGVSSSPAPVRDRFIWNQLAPDRPMMISAIDQPVVLDSVTVPWPIPDALPYRPDLAGFMDARDSVWVLGLWVGPYFAVGDGSRVSIHPFAGPHAYAYAQGRWRQNDPLADSAYFGARDVAIAGSRVFFLSGGRPRRRAHPEAPTRFIDAYGLDGRYQGSYELPFASWAFATTDGKTFFAVTNAEGAYPQVIGLRPRRTGR